MEDLRDLAEAQVRGQERQQAQLRGSEVFPAVVGLPALRQLTAQLLDLASKCAQVEPLGEQLLGLGQDGRGGVVLREPEPRTRELDSDLDGEPRECARQQWQQPARPLEIRCPHPVAVLYRRSGARGEGERVRRVVVEVRLLGGAARAGRERLCRRPPAFGRLEQRPLGKGNAESVLRA